MTIKLTQLKRRQPIIDTMTLPTSVAQKERYKRIKLEMEKRELESLHALTRLRIDDLLDEVERQLATAG